MKRRIICFTLSLILTVLLVPLNASAIIIEVPPWHLEGSTIKFTGWEAGTIVIPSSINGYTVRKIGSDAFYMSSDKFNVVIPETVDSINRLAFNYCGSMEEIYIPKSVTYIHAYCFGNSTPRRIYYQGSEQELGKITIDHAWEYNWRGTSTRIVCNSTHPLWEQNISFTEDELDKYVEDSGVDPYMYRADFILGSANTLENMEGCFDALQSYCTLYKEKADTHTFGSIARHMYDGFSLVAKMASNPTNIIEYNFKNQNAYEAVLFDIFEASVDYSISDFVDTIMVKDARKIIKQLKTEIEEIYKYEFTDSYNDLVAPNKMSVKTFNNLLESSFHDEYMEFIKYAKTVEGVDKFAKTVGSIEKLVENIVAFYNVSRLTQAEKEVLLLMAANNPSNTDLQNAISEFISVIDGGMEEYANAVFEEPVLKVSSKALSKSLWKKVELEFYTRCPEAYLIKLALNTGLFAGNMIFNADKIVDNYYNLVAAVDTENVLRNVYFAAKSQYINNKNSINAQIYNHSVDAMYNMMILDCNYASKYVRAIGDGALAKYLKLFGLRDKSDLLVEIESFKTTYVRGLEAAKTNWKYKLAGDYIRFKDLINIDTITISDGQTPNKNYNITFNSNYSDANNYTYLYSTSQKNWYEPVMTRKGYIFGGWYADTKCTREIQQPLTLTGDITLYAKWIPQQYIISYDSNGGEDYRYYQTKQYGISVKIMCGLERAGYEFVCWNTKSDGTGSRYNQNSNFSTNKNLVLYAIWQECDIYANPVAIENNVISGTFNMSSDMKSKNGILMVALYGDGRLLDGKLIQNINADNLEYTFSNIDNSLSKYNIKMFYWNNFFSMKPFTEAFELPVLKY